MDNFIKSVELAAAVHLAPWTDRAQGAAAPPPAAPLVVSQPGPTLPALPGPSQAPQVHRRRASKTEPDIPQATLINNPETGKEKKKKYILFIQKAKAYEIIVRAPNSTGFGAQNRMCAQVSYRFGARTILFVKY